MKVQSWRQVRRSSCGFSGRTDTHSHTYGQRCSLWFYRSGWAFAIECMVDGAGDSGGIHCPRASGTEWRARTDASGVQGRDDTARFAPPAGPTTANGSLAKTYNQILPTRVWDSGRRRGLSLEARASSPSGIELLQPRAVRHVRSNGQIKCEGASGLLAKRSLGIRSVSKR